MWCSTGAARGSGVHCGQSMPEFWYRAPDLNAGADSPPGREARLMRDDVVEASVVLGHPPDVVWQIVGAPDWYSRFVPEIVGFDMLAQARQGRGPRGTLRVNPPGGNLIEVPVQAVVYRAGQHVVWSAEPDDG